MRNRILLTANEMRRATGFASPGALAATRLLVGLLYHVSATDTPTFIVVPRVLTVTAALASYRPARRAAEIDPVVALQAE